MKETAKMTLSFSAPFLLILFLLFLALIVWERRMVEKEQTAEFSESASLIFEQLAVTRMWNAVHGGVYVEVGEGSQPNRYLEDPTRDIVTSSGKQYTKINPAYMTRQLAQLSEQGRGWVFRITSLRPINPSNAPADDWDRRALEEFGRGRSRETMIVSERGERFFRFAAPLKTEAACLACHAKHGYKEGDVQGAISITLPMRESDVIHMRDMQNHLLAYAIVGCVASLSVFGITWSMSRMVRRGVEKELEHNRLRGSVELAGAAAHEIRQPLTIIIGFAEMLPDKIARHESVLQETEIIIQQCKRINEIITKMLTLTQYRTKPYAGKSSIFDLGVDASKYEK